MGVLTRRSDGQLNAEKCVWAKTLRGDHQDTPYRYFEALTFWFEREISEQSPFLEEKVERLTTQLSVVLRRDESV